jgi:hypothetical protein
MRALSALLLRFDDDLRALHQLHCRAAIACRVFFFGGQERERYFSDMQRQADIDKWFNPVPNTSLDQPDILRMEGDDEDPNRCAAFALNFAVANTTPRWAAPRPARHAVSWVPPPTANSVQQLLYMWSERSYSSFVLCLLLHVQAAPLLGGQEDSPRCSACSLLAGSGC